MHKWSFWTGSFKWVHLKRHACLKSFFWQIIVHDLTCKQVVTDLLKQLTMALPDKLPVMLAPASAIVLAFSLRLSLIAPIRSMWLPLALRLPVRPPTLPSPMLGLCLVSATEVVSVEVEGGQLLKVLWKHIQSAVQLQRFCLRSAPTNLWFQWCGKPTHNHRIQP